MVGKHGKDIAERAEKIQAVVDHLRDDMARAHSEDLQMYLWVDKLADQTAALAQLVRYVAADMARVDAENWERDAAIDAAYARRAREE